MMFSYYSTLGFVIFSEQCFSKVYMLTCDPLLKNGSFFCISELLPSIFLLLSQKGPLLHRCRHYFELLLVSPSGLMMHWMISSLLGSRTSVVSSFIYSRMCSILSVSILELILHHSLAHGRCFCYHRHSLGTAYAKHWQE